MKSTNRSDPWGRGAWFTSAEIHASISPMNAGCCAIWLGLSLIATARVVEVENEAQLKQAVGNLEAGTTLRIAPGRYRGGFAVRGIERLVIEAADSGRPPEFVGGTNTRCPFRIAIVSTGLIFQSSEDPFAP